MDAGGGFQLFTGEPVHTWCLGGGDSHLSCTYASQPFARSPQAERREATAVSLSELETKAFPRGARSL